MKSRCSCNPDPTTLKYYADKGITVCDRWINSFSNFIDDMGQKPSPKHTIDRIDNSKGYSPDNCRWSTSFEQAQNKDNNITVVIDGRKINFSEACRVHGIDNRTAYARLRKGWSIHDVFQKPLDTRRKRKINRQSSK